MRRARKLEHFSFDIACVQCGHPHSHQQVPFACVALCVASRVLCGLGLTVAYQSMLTHTHNRLATCTLKNSTIFDQERGVRFEKV